MMSILWTEAELELLDELVNNIHLVQLPPKFQREAKKRGIPQQRSRKAIIQKIRDLKDQGHYETTEPTESNYTIRTLADALGLSYGLVRAWIDSGKLRAGKVSRFRRIHDKPLRDFAKKYPSNLAIAEWSALAGVFGEKEATRIKAHAPCHKQPVKVKHLPTGKVFPTIQRAAGEIGCTTSTVRRHLGKGNSRDWAKVG